MMYEYTQYNLISLMQSVGTLEREQLVRFFSDEMSQARIGKMLEKLVLANYLKYDPATEQYTYHAAPEIKKDIVDRKILAFWPLASWGSNSLLQIYPLDYPSQFMAITPDNIVYDITVCRSTNEAQIAKTVRDLHAVKGVADDINHMAVVTSASIGEQLRPYGFDMYCTIHPFSHEPSYTMLE